MRLSRALRDELIAHAQAEAPLECCGLILAQHGELHHVRRCTNAAQSEFRYEIDGQEQYRAFEVCAQHGWTIGAIYHSHTRDDAYPSQMDVLSAFYPDALYVIIGLAGPEPVVNGYWIRDGQVEQEPLETA